MKTSAVVASVLFSTFALAAPVDKRAYATKTEVHMEYYTVWTTVTGNQPAAASTAAASTDAALFFEKPSSAPAVATSVNTPPPPPPAPTKEATTEAPAPPKPTTTEEKHQPSTTSTQAPPPPPPTTTQAPPPPPSTTQAPPPPPPSTTQAAQPQPTQPSSGGGSGEVHSGGSFTMNYYGGGLGACGDEIKDSDMAVALAVDVFGTATVNPATGKTTNKWCNKEIQITYEGKTVNAWIKDRCSGCTNGGLDATPDLWEALTGGLGGPNGDRVTGMSWQLV